MAYRQQHNKYVLGDRQELLRIHMKIAVRKFADGAEIENVTLAHWQKLFRKIDRDGSGKLNRAEFHAFVREHMKLSKVDYGDDDVVRSAVRASTGALFASVHQCMRAFRGLDRSHVYLLLLLRIFRWLYSGPSMTILVGRFRSTNSSPLRRAGTDVSSDLHAIIRSTGPRTLHLLPLPGRPIEYDTNDCPSDGHFSWLLKAASNGY